MVRREKESLYYVLFPERPNSYVLVKTTSAAKALDNARKQYPECDRVISERDFDPKRHTEELLRIRAENQAEFDDF